MNVALALPHGLLLLLLIPCFWWCREPARVFYFSQIAWLRRESTLWLWESWLKVLIYALMVLALSHPYLYEAGENRLKKGRDLVLAVDASGSMGQSGYDAQQRFVSKYEINLNLVTDFLRHRHNDNIGMVVFGTFAYTASPLSYDLTALSEMLHFTDVGIAGESTAIGDALMQALRTLEPGEAAEQVVILLTDGFHNTGSTSPRQAMQAIQDAGVRLYTIGVGASGSYDRALLEQMAQEGGGRHFDADDTEALRKTYEMIDALEPSPIPSENYLNHHTLFMIPLGLALGLLIGWLLAQRREVAL
jgi:Ca-activated chloride channel homolog